jgi:D-alanine-D-alanine ligase
MSFSHKIRVGVLRGGPSPEYDVSLKTGNVILNNLPEEYEPIDIFISKDGAWYEKGLQKDPHKILKSLDAAVNALHGAYGEDGNVQRLLEELGVPFTGSGSFSSALGMNKILAKEAFRGAGLKTPHHMIVEMVSVHGEASMGKTIKKIHESMIFPLIVKPANSGSSLGVNFVERMDRIKDALEDSFRYSPKLLVEEYISGKEATCGVIEGFRGESLYHLLPVEILGSPLLSYESKYKNMESRYRVPGNFSEKEKKEIKEAAALAHQALGLRHYSRSDFIIHPRRGLFILEVNTLPEITHRSSFVKSLESAGGNVREFLSHLLNNLSPK